jgi:predicted nucleic acid-binding protein
MGTVILDSSVLLAVVDPHDALHEPAAEAVRDAYRRGEAFMIPTTVLAEVLVGASRQGTEVAAALESRIDKLVAEVRPIDRDVARSAAELRARSSSIKLPDALVIATGRVVDAVTVLTADKRWSGVDPRVRVIGISSMTAAD